MKKLLSAAVCGVLAASVTHANNSKKDKKKSEVAGVCEGLNACVANGCGAMDKQVSNQQECESMGGTWVVQEPAAKKGKNKNKK